MDTKSLHTLEFDKVRQRLAGYASFSAGIDLALNITPTDDKREAEQWQAETREAVQLFDSQRDISIGGCRDVRRAASNAQRGFTLLPEDFLEIQNTLIASRTLRRQLLRTAETNPFLAQIAELIEECPGLVLAISATLDEKGEVLDSASPKLATLRRELRAAHGRIQDRLQRLLNSSDGQYLQEPIITMRSGRYVVPLRADARGRVKGIIHDQSGSGATLWIEPLGTVELNNEYRSLQIQEEQEIARILAELSRLVAKHGDALQRIVERMAELDLIFARARLASETNAVEPIFVDWRTFPEPRPPKHANEREKWTPPPRNPHPGSTIWIRAARHPLLDSATVVPTDLLLHEDVFLVLITGPNTGGKTVSLKTMGLMTLMAQSGLHVPANEARLTVFDNVFADIGDEQSIEQSLSTFSGHITNVSRILKEVDDRSLVLLDELGSGTDPAEGAALAQSIVNYLRDKGATTFIATHYPELKLYASQTRGATNASLLFDVETLSPTYEMSIGLPGRSNALVIARRLGLDESILDEAMRLLGTGNSQAEAMLDSIYEMRDKIVAQEAGTRLALRQAEMQQEALEERLAQIERERLQVLAEARAEAQAELAALQEEIRQVRKKVRDAQSLNALKKASQETKALAEEQEEAAAAEQKRAPRRRRQALQAGDKVHVKTLNVEGTIMSVDGANVEVAVGRLTMRADLADLAFKERPEPEAPAPSAGGVRVHSAASPGMELDLRGQRVEEGLKNVEQYLDQAFLANLPWVRIIHGKGTGRLGLAVRKLLQKSAHVVAWEEGKDGEGGAGVTVVKLKGE
ncbi:MAG: Smr/MutS family protein [Anaerolineales bacterium]|nr:Smr/MutS family protein [Anaerolineales bacterium]